jgi:hypothetical protein
MDMVGELKTNDYRKQWHRYKRFKKMRFFLLLGWIPLIAVYILLCRTFGYCNPAFLGVYLLLNYAVGIYRAIWPCPRCRLSFSDPWRLAFRGGGYDQGIAHACVNCGLPRFAADDSGCVPLCAKCGNMAAGRFCSKCGTALNEHDVRGPGNKD